MSVLCAIRHTHNHTTTQPLKFLLIVEEGSFALVVSIFCFCFTSNPTVPQFPWGVLMWLIHCKQIKNRFRIKFYFRVVWIVKNQHSKSKPHRRSSLENRFVLFCLDGLQRHPSLSKIIISNDYSLFVVVNTISMAVSDCTRTLFHSIADITDNHPWIGVWESEREIQMIEMFLIFIRQLSHVDLFQVTFCCYLENHGKIRMINCNLLI